jgi:hypothetical protein
MLRSFLHSAAVPIWLEQGDYSALLCWRLPGIWGFCSVSLVFEELVVLGAGLMLQL